METVHISLYGGPGVGKSSIAAEAFVRLQAEGHSVAMTVDVAKQLRCTGRLAETHPFVVVADQLRQQAELNGKVDVILCDNPPLLDIINLPGAMRSAAMKILKEMRINWLCLDTLIDRHHNYQGVVPAWGTATQANWRHERIREFASTQLDSLVILKPEDAVNEIVDAISARAQAYHFTNGELLPAQLDDGPWYRPMARKAA